MGADTEACFSIGLSGRLKSNICLLAIFSASSNCSIVTPVESAIYCLDIFSGSAPRSTVDLVLLSARSNILLAACSRLLIFLFLSKALVPAPRPIPAAVKAPPNAAL